MKITIGENIKRLRREKNITQEQLAEYLNVSSAAVSKWERGDTLPDITLLFPLANYFSISIDDLMGYDATVAEREINDILNEYVALLREGKNEEAGECISRGIMKYHGDHRIMNAVAWHIAGGYADNDPKVLIEKRDELWATTESILDSCTDERIRLDARNLQAKICHAEGATEKALHIYDKYFSSWYQSKEQKKEQLFTKNTAEFRRLLLLNMYELISFAMNKKAKELWFTSNDDYEVIGKKALELARSLLGTSETAGSEELSLASYVIASDIAHKISVSVAEGSEKDITRALRDIKAKAAERFNGFAKKEPIAKEYISKTYKRDEL